MKPTPVSLIFAVVLFSVGCKNDAESIFEASFSALSQGATKADVRKALGEPSREFTYPVSDDLFDLEDPKLGLKLGDEIDAWAYEREYRVFTIWFAPGSGSEPVLYETSNAITIE